jgi:3-isopropylmalate/(R)-2-methylmalate dehydratase small subunit
VDAFTSVTAAAVPLDAVNIDTDRVIPARFLHKPRGPEYAGLLFHDVRFDEDGRERADFIMNQPAFRGARIIVAADNFGCGSSREHAVWALAAYGIRAIIAPSFGDIFFNNCFKIGVLPVVVPADTAAALRRQLHAMPGASITVDLETQTVTGPDGAPIPFTVDPFRRQGLLRGEDEIALTLGHEAAIAAFERRHADEEPWLAIERRA